MPVVLPLKKCRATRSAGDGSALADLSKTKIGLNLRHGTRRHCRSGEGGEEREGKFSDWEEPRKRFAAGAKLA